MGVFDFLVRRQRHVEALVSEYLDEWAGCLQEFRKAIDVYLEKGRGNELEFHVQRTHKRESRADDLRRNIELQMYSKALLPESRGDIMGFLESIDTVINRAETALFILFDEGVEMPPDLAGEFRHLIAKTQETTDILLEMARDVFVHNPDLLALVHAIDEKESECDYIERNMIRKIFESGNLDALQKVTLRDLILKVGDISDQSEKVADRMTILSFKRRS